MKKSFLILLCCLVAAFLAGCGGWLAKKQAEQQEIRVAKNPDDVNALLKTLTNQQGLPLDSIVVGKVLSKDGTIIYFDTEKCGLFPDLSIETVFVNPKYKALFGLTEDYDIVSTNEWQFLYYPNEKGNRRHQYLLRYKKIPIIQDINAAVAEERDSCIHSASVAHYTIVNEPSDVQISYEDALETALAQDYDLRDAPYWKQKMIDSLGYVPDAPFGFYPPKSYYAWRIAQIEKQWRDHYTDSLGNCPISPHYKLAHKYPRGAKFYFEIDPKGTGKASAYYPKGQLIYLYSDALRGKYKTAPLILCYRIEVASLYGGYEFVFIDAISGKFLHMTTGEYDAGPCEPTTEISRTPDYLWYYNAMAAAENITLSQCDNICGIHRLKQHNSNAKIKAFCRDGVIEPPTPPGPTPPNYIHYADWSCATNPSSPTSCTDDNNAHLSPFITLSISTPPSPFNSPTGVATLTLSENSTPINNYTYSGNQVLTTFGFAAHTITATNSGTSVTNLTAGIYQLNISSDDNCTYEEFVVIPGDNAPQISQEAISPPTCYEGGNIRISIANASSFGSGNLVIAVKGPISSNGIVAPVIAATVANSYQIDLNQFGGLKPGNYAVMVMNVGTNKVGAINVYLPYPNCIEERKVLQTAYWVIEKTQERFKNDLLVPLLSSSGTLITGMPSGGVNQFTNEVATSPRSIDLQLCSDFVFQAVASIPQMTPTSAPIRVSTGLDFAGNIFAPAVAIDILAHEYGHFINTKGVNVGSATIEAPAINEGFSDIMGLLAESYISPPLDWVIGSDVPLSSGFTRRNIADPLSDNKPSIYQGTNWSFVNEKYTNSRVFSYWFYLLSQGGSQTVNGTTYTVPALGIDVAAKITLAAFVNDNFGLKFVVNQNYPGLCQATTKAANALYPPVGGACSPEVIAVRQAWRAVGLDCWGSITPVLCEACAPTAVPSPTFALAPACGGTASGSISITNPTAGNTYAWSNGATTQNLTDLAAGTYTVTVSDAAGCSGSESVLLTNDNTQPNCITASYGMQNACNNVRGLKRKVHR